MLTVVRQYSFPLRGIMAETDTLQHQTMHQNTYSEDYYGRKAVNYMITRLEVDNKPHDVLLLALRIQWMEPNVY